jgi:glycosyltransferase involved in cell wall biosynthesis
MNSGPLDPTRVVALIPCYLEALHISEMVRRVREKVSAVLVVDDGSTDETASLARQCGAEVISHQQNAGKGAAIKTGLRALMDRDVDYVVLLDGDGQHLPEEIPHFLEAAAKSQAGIFLGNRMQKTDTMPLLRKWTNRLISHEVSRLCRQSVPDSQCGFRMVRRTVIPAILCKSNGYDYETEMLLVASRIGERVVSVPISTVYADEKSKIRPIMDGIRFFKLIWSYRN